MKIDFKDKRIKNALVIGLAIIVVIVMFYFLLGGSSNDRNDQEFQVGKESAMLNLGVPSTNDSINDMTLMDAFDEKTRDSIMNKKRRDDALMQSGGFVPTSGSQASTGFSDSDFEAMRSSAISSSSPPSTYSNNSHPTYGTSSMWENNSNANVGYSNLGNVVVKNNSKPNPTPIPVAPERIENNINFSVPIETQSSNAQNPIEKTLTKEQKLQQAIASKYDKSGNSNNDVSVVAQIYNNQKISANNAAVRIVLTEKIYINNTTIGTDAFIYGVATMGQNAINITVPNISYKGQNYQVNLVVYDYRTGEKGIPVLQENITGTLSKEAENQANQEVGRLGRVGSVLTSVFSGRNKTTSIQLNDGHRIYLKSK